MVPAKSSSAETVLSLTRHPTSRSGGGQADSGVGLLHIQSGTTVTVGNEVKLWSKGKIDLDGGKLQMGSLNSSSGQFDWNSGTVAFSSNTTLSDSLLDTLIGTDHSLKNQQTLASTTGNSFATTTGTFAVDGGKVQTTNFTNNGTTSVQKGSMELSGNLFNNASSTFVVENVGSLSAVVGVENKGNFVLDGAAAKTSGGLFTNNGTVSGAGRIEQSLTNNGIVQVNAGDHLTIDNPSSTNAGNYQFGGGRLDVTGKLFNQEKGFITGHGVFATSTAAPGGDGIVNNGVIVSSGNPLDIHGDVKNLGQGRILTSGNGTTNFWDDVVHNGSEIRTSLGSSTVFFGNVTGASPFTGAGSVFFEGDLKPGNSPASILFEGDMVLAKSAFLEIEIGGLTQGSQYDSLTVTGNAFLDGLLAVNLLDGFIPTIGDSFLVIENLGTDPLIGSFFGLDQGALLSAGAQVFQANYFGGTGNDFVLTSVAAIPEPSAGLLLVAGIGSVWIQRRRMRCC